MRGAASAAVARQLPAPESTPHSCSEAGSATVPSTSAGWQRSASSWPSRPSAEAIWSMMPQGAPAAALAAAAAAAVAAGGRESRGEQGSRGVLYAMGIMQHTAGDSPTLSPHRHLVTAATLTHDQVLHLLAEQGQLSALQPRANTAVCRCRRRQRRHGGHLHRRRGADALALGHVCSGGWGGRWRERACELE